MFRKALISFLESLQESFPDTPTATILQQIQTQPDYLNTLQLDWARFVSPNDIQTIPSIGEYFRTLQQTLPPQHLFHQLRLIDKYKALGNDMDAKNQFCDCLAELQLTALEDGDMNESNATQDDIPPNVWDIVRTLPNPDPTPPTLPTNVPQNRFEDANLHELCVQYTGDRKFVEDLRIIARKLPLLAQLYGNDSDELIARQLKAKKNQLKPVTGLLKTFLNFPWFVDVANRMVMPIVRNMDPRFGGVDPHARPISKCETVKT